MGKRTNAKGQVVELDEATKRWVPVKESDREENTPSESGDGVNAVEASVEADEVEDVEDDNSRTSRWSR